MLHDVNIAIKPGVSNTWHACRMRHATMLEVARDFFAIFDKHATLQF